MAKFKVGDYVIGNELANKVYSATVEGWVGKVVTVYDDSFMAVRDIVGTEEYCVGVRCFDLYKDSASLTSTSLSSSQTTATLGISDIKVVNEERNEYLIVNGKRDKSTKVVAPITSTIVTLSDGRTGTAICYTPDFDIRTGVLTAIANIVFDGKFETVYEKYNNKQKKLAKEANRIEHTCSVCGKTYNISEEARACEKAHVDRKKQKHENYLIRKEAKRRIAKAEKEGRIKEVMAELLKNK